jgi:hypothetical protein
LLDVAVTMRRLFSIGCLFVAAWVPAALAEKPPEKKTEAPAGKPLDEPGRIIRRNDTVRITLTFPDRKIGSLAKVEESGEVTTPEGSTVKAANLSLATFRVSLVAAYRQVPGYEDVQVEALIASSPYSVVKMPPPPEENQKPVAEVKTAPPAKPRVPLVYPRKFQNPMTVWQAIQQEGGVPSGIDARKIRVLKGNLARKTLDCSGKDGQPDGATPVESGDYIFLVTDEVAVSKIFD